MPIIAILRGIKPEEVKDVAEVLVKAMSARNLRTSLGVSCGIPWMYPRDKARRKVEMEGEPKER
jgi:hypothetical protein